MNIKFTARDEKVTSKFKDYVNEKLSKFEEQLEIATTIDIELGKIQSKGEGVKTFVFEITIFMPNAVIRVEEKGPEQFELVDKAEEVLRRRLQRYYDKLNSFDKEEGLKNIGATEQTKMPEDFTPFQADFEPQIVKYKEYSDNTPMRPEEAIDRMELLGHRSYLFRNIESGKYAMVYKRDDGNYGLVEPKEG
ncbi:MAG: ribosome hibernation-promoting factor, HPF/YfiA family [Candidatus Pacearchaeota archaeon]